MRGASILLCILLCNLFAVQAQKNKNQLQKEKQQNLDKIKESERILAETTKLKKNTLGELSVVKQRIQQQEALMI